MLNRGATQASQSDELLIRIIYRSLGKFSLLIGIRNLKRKAFVLGEDGEVAFCSVWLTSDLVSEFWFGFSDAAAS